MTSPESPRLKSPTPPPTGTDPAEPAPGPTGRSAPKVAARQGVLSAVRPDPHVVDGREPVSWLHVVAPKGAVPTATSWCRCGRDRSAVGRTRVLALIEEHTAHSECCPLRATERTDAA
jgi:hypothetical protein